LLYGIRHVFSSDKKGVGRGLATGWNNPSITSEMNPPEMPFVWSHSYGNVVGELLQPLYAGVPDAASRDKQLYVLLSLIDILRTGKPRELKHAKELLIDKIEDLYR
jgi:hypothetical protein